MTFLSTPAAARKVLNQISGATEQFFIIRLVHIRNEKDKGPLREVALDRASDLPTAASPGPAGSSGTKSPAAGGAEFHSWQRADRNIRDDRDREAQILNWLRAHYDRVAVLTAALFFLCSAFMIARSVSQFGQNFSTLPLSPPPKPALPPPKAVELEHARRIASTARAMDLQWTLGPFRPREALYQRSGPTHNFADHRSAPART